MSAESQLSDGEQSVLTLHPHWKTLLRPALLLFVVVVIAATLLVVIPPGRLAGPGRIAVGVIASRSCAGRPPTTGSPPGGCNCEAAS
jgi:hypothetical protein